MGGILCCLIDNYKLNQFSKKLMQFKILNTNLVSFDKKLISIYDIEYENGIEMEACIRIIKDFQGISQLNFNNSLFLCGSNLNDYSVGAYFLKYDPNNNSSGINFLINCKFYHYGPTLIPIKNEHILAIGGLKSRLCEIFSIKNNTWKIFPELPEERYKCSALSSGEYVFVFGGYDSDKMINMNNILKLSLKSSIIWETIEVHNNHFAKCCSCVLNIDSNIYILGGVCNDFKKTDDIIEYDIINNKITILNSKLCKASSFIQVSGTDLNKKEFMLFDDEFYIHKLSKNDFKISLIDYNGYINNIV